MPHNKNKGMVKMKKLILLLTCLFLAVGCACSNNKAKDAVGKYLNDYKGLKDNVLSSIDDLVAKENLEHEEQGIYKDVLKKQYRDLIYTIENEEYNGDNATVTAKITVYDLYKASKNASTYLQANKNEFLTNGEYDKNKYLKYKLNKMKDTKDTIAYTITFKLKKENGKWQVEQPDEETLEKIHGIYNYEEK